MKIVRNICYSKSEKQWWNINQKGLKLQKGDKNVCKFDCLLLNLKNSKHVPENAKHQNKSF